MHWPHRISASWLSARSACPSRMTSVNKTGGRHHETRRSTKRTGHHDRHRLCARTLLPVAAGGRRGGHHQDRCAALAVGHDGDQRNHFEGLHADAGAGSQRQGRPARQEGRGSGRRSGIQLAAVRRKGPRPSAAPEGLSRLRLLDLRVPEVGAAGIRGAQRPAVYPLEYEGEESSNNVFYGGSCRTTRRSPLFSTS